MFICFVINQADYFLLDKILGRDEFYNFVLLFFRLFACSRNSRTMNKKTQTKIFDEVFMLSSELLNVEVCTDMGLS